MDLTTVPDVFLNEAPSVELTDPDPRAPNARSELLLRPKLYVFPVVELPVLAS